uniref:Peptidase S1 domain-containing protein n=1 Tax=Anopheles melas TaxID=34690 RepID=A0A182TPK1_9DIPT
MRNVTFGDVKLTDWMTLQWDAPVHRVWFGAGPGRRPWPAPQPELITCLANSSTLNVTTKHCDCEAYSCKDLLASSSPSPLNSLQPKRKIHTSCREHCCRKKKFNRSIDPAALENVVAPALGPVRRYNTVATPAAVHRSPMGLLSFKQPEELIVWSERAPERPEEATRWPVGRILLPEKFATTFERLENNVVDRAAAPPASSRSPPEHACYTVSLRKTNLPSTTAPATQPPPAAGSTGADDWLANDGTNYVTTNISIFPATECRPEHREYLQHDGNLCAGYGAAKNRSIDVDYSGSPLICDQLLEDGKLRRTVQGLLTWSTDINHAPHLFTNLTTYRPWIDREIEKLDAETRFQRPPTVPRPITVQTVPVYRNPNVLYG